MKRIAVLLSLLAVPALAHEMPSNHGGIVAEAGSFHIELVASGEKLDLYLTDHSNKAVSSAGFKATAVLVIDGKVQRLQLTPAEGNKLTGASPVALPSRPKGAIQLQTASGVSLQGKLP